MTHPLIIDGELVLYGYVGGDPEGDGFFYPKGFSARDVIAALEELSGDIRVRVNSPGGLAIEGVAIYRALAAHKGQVEVHVDAVAASAASIITMAGQVIAIPESALLMIHDAAGRTLGNAEDHLKTAAVLEKLDDQMATIYAAKTGKSREEIKALMDAETWLNGREAVEQGFADEVPPERPSDPVAFDYRIYAHAPDSLKELSRQLASQRERCGKEAALSAVTGQKEKPMTDKSKGSADNHSAAPTTVEELRAAFPDLVAGIESAAAKAERDRINGIEEMAVAGYEKIVAECKADPAVSPEAAAARILRAQKQQGDERAQALKDVEAEAAVDAAPKGDDKPAGATPKASNPDGWKSEYEASETLQDEFASAEQYVAFKTAEKDGRARRLSRAS